jgi:thiamine-phosphate pyrophosphorylase
LLYLITERLAFLRSPEISLTKAAQLQLELIGKAAQAGCQLIQIREKDMSARALGEFTREAIERARPHGARVLVNDRFDVALAEVRALTAKKDLDDFLIGVSTHSTAEARLAEEGGADFIVCGPVYDTPSKRSYGVPLGLEVFAEIRAAVKIPVLAIGGVNLSNYREVLRRGAAGVAAISLFADLDSLEHTIRFILNTQFPG